MARLLADENVPLEVVEELRARGHDVSVIEPAFSGAPDSFVLALACGDLRAVVTLDRRDFFRLHRARPDHEGIIACTFDRDFAGQAQRIHEALPADGILRGMLLRVNRPQR